MNTKLDFLPILFKKIKVAMQQAANSILINYDLSSIYTMYIMTLYHQKNGLTMKQMSEFINVDKANTTRVITNLVKKMIVEEEDSKKIRNKKYRLTTKGIQIASEIHVENRKIEATIQQTLSGEEWNQLILLTQKISLIDFKAHF